MQKISGRAVGAKKVSKALAPLYIVNPLQSMSAIGLFSTHPPTEKRIKILRSMAGGAGFLEYEEAYKKIHGAKKGCLGAKTLEGAETLQAREGTPVLEPQKDAVTQAREVTDLFNRLVNFMIIPCACGVRIKVPPDFKRDTIPCPRCGRKHPLSSAQPITAPGRERK